MSIQPTTRPIALTIAGSDSSGGAGIQADLKTFSAFDVYGASVITALTAQNTIGVQGVHVVPTDFVKQQLNSVQSDLNIKAIKVGMLANAQIIECVAETLVEVQRVPLIIDPVMVATSGDRLLAEEAEVAFKRCLFPLATLVTPNLHEAAVLLSTDRARGYEDMIDQGRAILGMGPSAVLMKGGHLDEFGDEKTATDVLVWGDKTQRFSAPWINTKNTHGTGCTLAAAIAAGFALGLSRLEAIARAKAYVTATLVAGLELDVGQGHGPVDHLVKTTSD